MSTPTPRLPLVRKLLYASDQIGNQAIAQTRNLWLLFFLVPPEDLGLPAAVPGLVWGPIIADPRVLVGGLLTVGRIIEALDDPIIGWWSDRTRSRWGRRIPFILFSTPPYVLCFALLWITPWGNASVANAVYLFVILELFFLGASLSGGPYEALFPELVRSHQDRMSLVLWQLYFGILGAVLGLVLSGIISGAFDFKVMGAVMAGVGLCFRYLGLSAIWDQAPRDTPVARIPLREAFRHTLTNTQFLYFLPTFVLFQLAVVMITGWLPFFVTAVLGSNNSGGAISLITLSALAAMVLGAFGLWKLSNPLGKRWVYSACLLGTAIYMPFLFFAGFIPGIPKLAQGLVMAFLAGIPMAGVNLLPRAITADITDYDHLRTGMRREGMFYMTQNLFEKIGSSFAPLLLALVLTLGETAENPLGIRLVGPVAGFVAFFSYCLFRGYGLPSTVTRESVIAAGLDVDTSPLDGRQ